MKRNAGKFSNKHPLEEKKKDTLQLGMGRGPTARASGPEHCSVFGKHEFSVRCSDQCSDLNTGLNIEH